MPNRRALVAAINDYGGNGSNNLPSCINDANGFTNEVLKNPSFAFDQIHTLLDADATVAKVQSELDWLVKDAKSDDRLVFYFSGHGYTQLVDGVMEEFLVLREAGGPALFADNLFVDKVKNLPEGVFTAVIDSCFSGGNFKLFTLAGAVEVAQTKTLPFPPEAAQPKAFTLEPVAGSETNRRIPLRGYRRWGCATRAPLAASKVFSLGDAGGAKALSDPSEAPQPEVSGLLVSACLETETAAASTSVTRGMSAFTFALLETMKHQPNGASAETVFNATGALLKSMNFRQTPMLLERERPGDLKNRTFLLMTSTREKAFTMPDAVDEKLFGALLGRLVQVIPQVAPIVFDAVVGRRKALEFGSAASASSAEADEKFIGAILGTLAQVIPQVAPILLDALSTRRKSFVTAGAAPAESDEKFLGSILSTLAQVIPHIAPVIVDAVSGRRKVLEGTPTLGQLGDTQADEKFIGALLGAVARVIPVIAPAVIQAVSGRRKELEGLPTTIIASAQADEKFLGAVLGALAQVIPHVAPLVLDAIAGRQKALDAIGGPSAAADFEADEKFLGAVFRTTSRCIPFIVPRIVDAVAGRPKGLEGVMSLADTEGEADEKFLGAILGTLAQVIPHVAPMIVEAFAGQRKELVAGFAGSTSAEQIQADEKFFGLVVGALASVIPHVAPIIIDAVRGRRKELELSLGGAAVADEKFFGDILRVVRQVLPTVAALAPSVIRAVAAQRKELEIPLQPVVVGATPEVDEKFLGAVLSTLGRVLPIVAPAILQAIGGQRKELTGFQAPTTTMADADEKFLGAVLSALGRVLPVVAPAILQAVTGQRKELAGLETAGAAPSAEVDEKFLGAVLSALGQVLPVVAPALLQAISGQQKEFTAPSAAAASAAPVVDEKLLSAILARLPQTMPGWFPGIGGYPGRYGIGTR